MVTSDGGAARQFQNEVEVGTVGIDVPAPTAYHSFGGWKNPLFGDTHAHDDELRGGARMHLGVVTHIHMRATSRIFGPPLSLRAHEFPVSLDSRAPARANPRCCANREPTRR